MMRRGFSACSCFPAEAPAFHRAGLEVLDQHVGFERQGAHRLLPFAAAQVQAHRALVARLHLPPHRGAVAQQAPLAQRIADAVRLDLDHVGAEFRQRLAGEGAGDELAELQHLEAFECFHVLALSLVVFDGLTVEKDRRFSGIALSACSPSQNAKARPSFPRIGRWRAPSTRRASTSSRCACSAPWRSPAASPRAPRPATWRLSAASRRLSDFEAATGSKLLERSPQGIALTPAGHVAHAACDAPVPGLRAVQHRAGRLLAAACAAMCGCGPTCRR